MKNKSITQTERLQLIGLLALSLDLCKQEQAIERAAAKLLGVDDDGHDYGHVSDAVYGSRTPDELLKLLGISVRDEDV